ncbi:hypothetical protein [Nocardia huaxiensis]|uniref:Uncharacterized protein n=1 Tax=Nocardia huaxiensis TaxID=2755382 RepID=A0A7D6ZLV0_9NOCA|nr:hypothetical protein [Nocardia huaxiensis]QLY32840.1 hypothetical protein H0264_11850 [Nocardia huaxiensis]UFS93406.1 hypothetical protein LPY97_21495 [Nocardia huaxiensis]
MTNESRRVGPWATRFDSEEAFAAAESAARATALRDHDLTPVLRFDEIYGSGPNNDKATAFGFDPHTPVAPDGSYNYVHGDFSAGLVYAVYRPAPQAVSGIGPEVPAELANTTMWPYPGGNLDPTTVPLSSLGLDIDGVDRRFVHFCAAGLGVEAADDLHELRPTFELAWPDYRDTIRTGLTHLVQHRPIDPRTWYELTYIPFSTPDQLALYLAQVYAYLFDGFDSMPVAP